MISDEELKRAVTTDVELEIMAFCVSQDMTVHQAETLVESALKTQEMAQELLQQREAEHAIWENVPEWANWFALDAGWFYQCKPHPGDSGEWENLAGVAEPAMHDGWETSLQERPK